MRPRSRFRARLNPGPGSALPTANAGRPPREVTNDHSMGAWGLSWHQSVRMTRYQGPEHRSRTSRGWSDTSGLLSCPPKRTPGAREVSDEDPDVSRRVAHRAEVPTWQPHPIRWPEPGQSVAGGRKRRQAGQDQRWWGVGDVGRPRDVARRCKPLIRSTRLERRPEIASVDCGWAPRCLAVASRP